MYKKGRLYDVVGGVIFLLLVCITRGLYTNNAMAGYDVGTGVNTSGGECRSFTDPSVNWYWDTCYGLSWQYYEWPKDSSGNPIDADVEFYCTNNTCGTKTKNRVSKNCGKPEYGGGFWYLGYEVASPSGVYGGGSGQARNFGIQVGKPRAGMLAEWVSTPFIPSPGGVGLYPIGTKASTNSDFASYTSYQYLSRAVITHEDLTNKGYKPRKCSEIPGGNKPNSLTQCAAWYDIWPQIKVGNSYMAVEAKYYGVTDEVHAIFDANEGLSSAADFKDVNWFCSAERGAFSGLSGVQIDSGAVEYNGGTNSETSPASVTHSASPKTITSDTTITFHHQINGKGSTSASFAVNQNSLKSGAWQDRTVPYQNKLDTAVTWSRSRVVSPSELNANGTTICDTMTFAGNVKSTACVTLKPQTELAPGDVKSKSSVTAPAGGTNSATTDTATTDSPNPGTKTVEVNVTVPSGSGAKTVDVTFNHYIMAQSSTNTGNASTNYKITQSTSGSGATVQAYGKNNTVYSKSISVTPSAPSPIVTADNPTITVSGITATTNITVCQTLTLSYGGDRKTTVCAHIKGNEYTVKGKSSVGKDSSHAEEATTGFVNSDKSVKIDRTIYAPYGDDSPKISVYFKHELEVANTASVSSSALNVGYTVKRGSTSLKNDKVTSTGTHTVYGSSYDAPIGKTCQTLSFTYNTYSGTPQACVNVTASRPTFTGTSTVSGGGDTKTASSNGDTKWLNTIKLRIASGKSSSATITFSHDMKATFVNSGDAIATGKSTGTVPFGITKSYTTDGSGNFSGTFPSNSSSSMVYTKTVSADSKSVSVTPGNTEEVCQTLTFLSAWSTKVCAKVVGELSLPTVQSRSGVAYKTLKKTSDWATKASPSKTADDLAVSIPIFPSEDANGGLNIPVTFTHNVQATLSELSEQYTGSVPYTLTTTGATDNTGGSNSFNITVKTAEPTKQADPITSNKYVNARIGSVSTSCQTLEFTYDGVKRTTKACVKFKGVTAEPKGTSTARVTGVSGSADSGGVDGAVSEIVVNTTGRTIRGSDIIFNHRIDLKGEMSVTIPFTIENDFNSKYNWSSSLEYTGNSPTSFAQTWLYIRNGSYYRPTSITDADAAQMINTGSVCETLKFTFDGTVRTSTACIRFTKTPSLPICPEITGNASINGGTTSSQTFVMSERLADRKQTTLYAKPTDKIRFVHCYYPGAQATRYTSGDESQYNNVANRGKTVIIPARNAYVETANEFTIVDSSDIGSYLDFQNTSNAFELTNENQIMKKNGNSFSGTIGNANMSSVMTSVANITTNAVGNTISQALWTYPGYNAVAGHSQGNCGSGCIVYYQNTVDNMWYSITAKTTNPPLRESSIAQVVVPYNYKTTASINTGNGYVYAGESMSGKNISVNVQQRYNSLVEDTYATKTAPSTVRLFMFYSMDGSRNEGVDNEQNGSSVNPCSYYGSTLGYSECVELPTEEGYSASNIVFNENSKLAGDTKTISAFRSSYNVPDIPAGSKVCMGVSVYPSGSTDSEASNNNTFVSKAYCRIVAKKPSFQIWGGSLYSAGDVVANQATKYTINGVYSYNPVRANGAPSITFGSWVEQSIMANGVISGVASGAATGYGATNLTVNAANPGGSASKNYCDLSRLSFANVNCATGVVGQFGLSGESHTKTTIKQKYADKAAAKDADKNSSGWATLDLSNAGSYTQEENTRYTYASGNLAIRASGELGAGITHVIYAKGNVTIQSSLRYASSSYQNIDQIPQYIIVADGNIYIEPSAVRIDAILVAGKNINTCAKLVGGSIVEATKASGSTEITGLYCGQQLKINGVVIADGLKLYRIYGASTGLTSIDSAEIIDYTPSIYLWGNNSATTSTPEVHTTYQRELAPRQ